MRPREYGLTFAAITAVILIIELIVGDKLSGLVVATALCVATGGTLGVAYRRSRK
jgi:hypothetical protein